MLYSLVRQGRLTKLTSSYIVVIQIGHYYFDAGKYKCAGPPNGPMGPRKRSLGGSAALVSKALDQVVPRQVAPHQPHTLIGLVGRGIQSSRTPKMHELEAARLGLFYDYVLVDFDELALPDPALGAILKSARAKGFAGLNVTHPFKQAVVRLLDALIPEAGAIGAVNTIVFGPSGAVGHNTDSWGFAESFREGMADAPLQRVVLFGAGGAGAAVAYALMELGVGELSVIDTDGARATALCAAMRMRFPGRIRHEADPAKALRDADGLVNATPVGMTKYPGMPFPQRLLSRRHWVAEIIYFPVETELLRKARALGCRTLPGTGMAIYQAVRAFELFTGKVPDRHAMAAHFAAAA
jgi:shikimate dehydrogenase